MFKGRHFDQSVILLCLRWYLAYTLSLRDLEEMMAERVEGRPCIAGSPTSRRSCWSASTGASVWSAASGIWTRRTSRSAAMDVSLPRYRHPRRHGRVLL